MLSDLFMTIGKGVADQLAYWAHTYLPFNKWRGPTDEVVQNATRQATRCGIADATVDRRRAYQVARMLVPNRHGEHLADLVPDAYNLFSPTSCGKAYSGKKKIAAPAERQAQFIEHPQTLAYLLTPANLARQGLGASPPGTVMGVARDQAAPPAGVIASDIRGLLGGDKGGRAVDEYAKIVAKLHAGPTQDDEEPAAA